MSSAHEASRVLVLGVGNVLCGDDGAGVVAVHRLARQYGLSGDVTLVDGGTLGLSLLPYLAGAECALILDAVFASVAPGTVLRFEGEEVGRATRERLSVHQVGVGDLLNAARWIERYPRRIVLLGVVAEAIGLGLGCSSAVEASIDVLVSAAVAELERFGISCLARASALVESTPLARTAVVLGL